MRRRRSTSIIASANPSTSYGATITATLAAGDYTIVTASAGQYGSVGQYTVTVTINLAPMNRPPQIVTVGEQWAVKGEELSFVVSAFDPDVPQQTLLYSLEPGAPAGAAIDPVTGRFSWTPDSSAEARSYALDIRVTDSGTPPLADVVKMAINVAEFHEFAGSAFVRRGSFANLSGNGVFYEGKFFEETLLVPLATSDGTGEPGGKTKTPPAKSRTLTAAEIALIDQAIVEDAPGAANPLNRCGEAACPPAFLPVATARVFAGLGRSA